MKNLDVDATKCTKITDIFAAGAATLVLKKGPFTVCGIKVSNG